MTESKRSPLPWRDDKSGIIILDSNYVRVYGHDYDNNRFIVLACNHFEEMREQIESATTMYGMNDAKCVADSATELLAKLKEAEDES